MVHHRRLWAQVRSAPDELGRSVIWDLTVGSYDRHLQWLARERAEHDPPPLTRERLLELVAAITGDDNGDRRLAESDLTEYADAQYVAELERENGGWRPTEPEHPAWHDAYPAGVEAGTHDAA